MKSRIFLLVGILFSAFASAQESSPVPGGELTLNEAIALALKNNLNIEIERYNPSIRDTDITLQESRFEPLFTANLGTLDQTVPSGSSLVGLGSVNTKNQNWDIRFEQLLKTGTSYDVQFNNGRNDTGRLFEQVNPRYDSSLFANVTQPLLRGFGKDVTVAPIRIAEQNRLASDFQLQQRIADTALEVEQAYWDLVFARGELDVVKQALTTAQNLHENNKKQVEVGTMAPLEIVVAEAEVAQREQQIIRVQTAISNTTDRLRFLLYGRDAVAQPIVPTDQPVVRRVEMSEEEAIEKALAGNPDLQFRRADLEGRKLNSKLTKDALKPQLDLRAGVGGTGLGGDSLVCTGDPFNPICEGIQEGGYNDSLTNLFDNFTWSVGFLVGIPIGNGRARADHARADLEEKQANSTVDQTRQGLVQSVRSIMRNMEDNLKTLEAARASRVLQERKLDAERKKLEVGLSTNYVVLEFTSDLAVAQSSELQAMVEYNKNYAQFQRFLGTATK